jgi:putative membrane protein
MHMRFGGFGGPGPGNGVGPFFLLFLILVFMAILFVALSAAHRRDGHGHSPFSHHGPGHHGPDHHGPGSHGPSNHGPGHHFEGSGNNTEARNILDRRFAAGEIDEDEYVRRRKLLEGDA